MTEFRLVIDIYAPKAIADSIQAFAHLCPATSYQLANHTMLKIEGTDETLHAELLNYILALSAQTFLEQ